MDTTLDATAEWIPPTPYYRESIRGARLTGWNDLAVLVLAKDLGVSPHHLRQVLTGRSTASIQLYLKTAALLGIGMDGLLARIEAAKAIDAQRYQFKKSQKKIKPTGTSTQLRAVTTRGQAPSGPPERVQSK